MRRTLQISMSLLLLTAAGLSQYALTDDLLLPPQTALGKAANQARLLKSDPTLATELDALRQLGQPTTPETEAVTPGTGGADDALDLLPQAGFAAKIPPAVNPQQTPPNATPELPQQLPTQPSGNQQTPLLPNGDSDLLTSGGPLGGGDLLGGGELLGGGDNLLGGNNGLGGGAAAGPLSSLGPAAPSPTAGMHNPHAGVSPHSGASSTARPLGAAQSGKDPHEAIWTEHAYPSAETCKTCHQSHYEEWRSSSHAYAMVSPMFTRFEQAMVDYTKGTVGHFCMRCHSPVGTQLQIPRTTSALDMPPVVREGVTCIACHHVNESYGRSNGDRRIEPGDIHAPVGSPSNGAGIAHAIANAQSLKLKTDASQTGAGQHVHNGSFFYEPLKSGDVCKSCHQVSVHPGIFLEVVHSQYRASPAHAKGIKCQECHMGAVPGKPYGYEQAHIAELGGKPYGEPRAHANHNFWGPGYSIAHPGIFPFNPKAKQFTPREWLQFDYRAGWGTDSFEDHVAAGTVFPPAWESVDDRIDGRRIVDANLAKNQEKRGSAAMTLEAGMHIGTPNLLSSPRVGYPLKVGFKLTNISEGHNFPTASLGAQPQSWLNVVLIDPDGCRVWETGYLDTKGDLADMHSVDVAKGIVRPDLQLVNLQTKFLINNGLRGTDREAALPVNFSVDQLPFLRPGAVPVTVLNHPPLIRMESHALPPLGTRHVKYKIPAAAFAKPGAYRLSYRMRCRTEPMYFMRQINATPDMIQRMLENMQDICLGEKSFLVR